MSLDNQIKNFEKAKNGSELKSSLILLLEALIADSGYNAGNLSGYMADEFVTKEKLQAEAESINDAIDYVMKTQAEGATIYSRLSSVSEIKEQIRLAVNEIYGSARIPTTGEGAAFEEYVTALLEIPDEVDVKVLTTVTAEENGTYEPEEGEAFGTVLVSVPQQTLTTRVITKNGTYSAEQDGADGYEYVQVAVTGSADSYTVRFMSADGQNVLYTARNIPYGGYAVFGGEYPASSEPDEYFTGWNPSPENVTQDMDCYPVFGEMPTGFDYEIPDTWEQIVANHGSGYPIGSYKFITFNPETILRIPYPGTKPVFKYQGSGQYAGRYTSYIYAEYKGLQPLKMRKVSTGESGTTSTWCSVTLLKATSIRYITGICSSGSSETPDWTVTSEWYSINAAVTLSLFFYYQNGKNHGYTGIYNGSSLDAYAIDYSSINDGVVGWNVSDLREYLNNNFINFLPSPLISGIKSVYKNSCGININNGEIVENLSSRDKIWVPSIREYFGTYIGKKFFAYSDGETDSSGVKVLRTIFEKTSAGGSLDYSGAIFTGENLVYNDKEFSELYLGDFGNNGLGFRDLISQGTRKPSSYSNTTVQTPCFIRMSATSIGGYGEEPLRAGLNYILYDSTYYCYTEAGGTSYAPLFGFCL